MTHTSFMIPIKTLSESNNKEHWSKKRKRHLKHKFVLLAYLRHQPNKITLPCSVTITRIAPRKLDSDRLPVASAHLRDCIADFLIPGLAPGRADGDSRISWHYCQEKGLPKEYAVKFNIVC